MALLVSNILNPYIPKKFGREYYDVNGSLQYPMFAAVALGVKPLFDDWVSADKYQEYADMCSKYGLEVVPDIIFIAPKDGKKGIIGGENITTTYAKGIKFGKNIDNGNVHVFVSKTRSMALEAKKFGWYPAVINNRATNKPYIDHIRFGRCLGFPNCCIDFFRKYNNWHLYSNPYETLKNTPAINRKARGSYYCNNFLMDHTYSLIHHLPCSYRCQETIMFAKKVEEKIMDVEPDFVEKAAEALKKPLLVFSERNFILFDGFMAKHDDNFSIDYKRCQYFQNTARPEDAIDFFDYVGEGNNIIISKGKIMIRDDNSALKTIEKKPEWFAINFD
ncbi:hypothetical protein HYU09_02570 [Candidatus Woesearchaeota archaeon]|nr:hypothetical protein [Candidatus Woesearchaeota archaeon]